MTSLPSRNSRSAALNSGLGRTEVPPPSLRMAPVARWDRFLFWLSAPAAQEVAPPLSRLPVVRDAFRDTLEDLDAADAGALAERVAQARTMRELWHLRAEVYRVVSLQRSQAEAERRVAELDRHFVSTRRGTRALFTDR